MGSTPGIASVLGMTHSDPRLLSANAFEIDAIAIRRMQLIVLALCNWRRKHGRLPDALEELVPAYFDALPLDPWSGRPFRYSPSGTDRVPDMTTPKQPFLAGLGPTFITESRPRIPLLNSDGTEILLSRWQLSADDKPGAIQAISIGGPIVVIPSFPDDGKNASKSNAGTPSRPAAHPPSATKPPAK